MLIIGTCIEFTVLDKEKKMERLILDDKGYFSHIGSDPIESTIAFNEKWNKDNLPSRFHKWNEEKQDFILEETKEYLESLLAEVYSKQDTLRDKMLKNDYKYRIKSPETYEQYKTEYDEEMKVLILQEQELKTTIDGK
jgi:hypothetical protein